MTDTKTSQVGNAGKYDETTERLSVELDATAIVLIVIDGKRGNGMSVSVNPARPGALEMFAGAGLARVLRAAADKLDGGERPNGIRVTTGIGRERRRP